MEIKTFQISGAGNTFSLFWDNDRIIADNKKSIIAKNVCEQTKTDGFIFLRWQSQKASQENRTLEWDFFNNDGSVAEMCGNASRCVAFYLKNVLKSKLTDFILNTVAGKIHLKIINDSTFEIQMTPIKKMNHSHFFWCDTGVPHIVVPIDNFEDYKNQKDYIFILDVFTGLEYRIYQNIYISTEVALKIEHFSSNTGGYGFGWLLEDGNSTSVNNSGGYLPSKSRIGLNPFTFLNLNYKFK